MAIQLKSSDSFVKLVTRVKAVRGVVLCEGLRDAEVLKALAERVGFAEALSDVAVTDSEGFNALRGEVLPSLLALIMGKVISRPKPLAVVVDADRLSPRDRVEAIADSLRSRGYRVADAESICNGTWVLKVAWSAGATTLLAAVNGVFVEPFATLETHELEDHVAYLKLLMGLLTEGDVRGVRKASELVSTRDFALIESSSREHLEKAFEHFLCLHRTLARLAQDDDH